MGAQAVNWGVLILIRWKHLLKQLETIMRHRIATNIRMGISYDISISYTSSCLELSDSLKISQLFFGQAVKGKGPLLVPITQDE